MTNLTQRFKLVFKTRTQVDEDSDNYTLSKIIYGDRPAERLIKNIFQALFAYIPEDSPEYLDYLDGRFYLLKMPIPGENVGITVLEIDYQDIISGSLAETG